ncbi:MAG: hypothetical protein HOC71_11970, partial [Candidatus Latescibacteria bacterium]|nr:hypothetical protein [Candidatus Latescibacterota bacterium]
GISQSTITATVIDSLGQPLPGAQVIFASSNNVSITPQSFSNENGRAIAILRSIPSITDISCVVTATTQTGKIAKVAAANDGAAKTARAAGLIGTTTVILKGVTISGSMDKTTVLANDADSTLVTINLKETSSGDPVKDATIKYSTTLGTLRTVEDVTDTDGNAEVVLFGGNVAGTSVFTAAYADSLVYASQISLIKQIYMTIESNPSVLSANGTDISAIKAYLFDADNNPIQNETVYFKTEYGTILPSAVTDEWGEATVNLRSSRFNRISTVTARYGTLSKSTPVRFTGSEMNGAALPLVLVGDGETKSKITVSLNDASGASIVDAIVTLSTSLGTLHSADLLTSGTSIVDSTSTDGKVTAYLSSDNAGDALVTFVAPGVRDSLEVHFTDYTFSLAPEKTEVLAGGEEIEITATLKDKDGNIIPISVDDIEFFPTLGTITAKVESGDGSVIATLVSGNNAGPSTITASIKDPAVTSSASITFIAADVGSLTLEATKNFVRIGDNESQIIAKVFDTTGNPKSDVTVTFSIVKGPGGGERLDSGTAETNDIGQAIVTFMSGMSGSKQNGIEIMAKVGAIADTTYLTITGQPESVVVGYSDSFVDNGDGTYGLQVSSIVSDVNRNKVVDGTIVNFSLIGDVGVIAPEVVTVDGVATTMLKYSPSDAGKKVTVTVSSGGKQDSALIILPGTSGTPASLSINPAESQVIADGIRKVSFSIYLTDTDGQPLSQQTVHCSTDIGTIQPTAITGDPSVEDSVPGRATVVYTSMASRVDRVATVTMSIGDLAQTANVYLKGVTLSSTAEPNTLMADGQSQSSINVLIKETTTHIPIASQEVMFGASDGYIEGLEYTNKSGVATTTFTSGSNAGLVYIVVSYGNTLIDTVEVNVTEVPTPETAPGAPQSIELSFSPPYTNVLGSGLNETLIITANVKDNKNNLVIDGNLIKFELVGTYDPLVSISPPGDTQHESSSIPTLNGIAKVSFHSGTKSGTIRVKATVIDNAGVPVSPTISSETTQFLIYSGPPYLDMTDSDDPFTNSRITVYSGPINIFAYEFGTEANQSNITVTISDEYQNPVPAGTAVYFTTSGGYITTASGYTDEEGTATVTLYGGNPYPTLTNSGSIVNPNAHIAGQLPSFSIPTFDFDMDGSPNHGIAVVSAYTEGRDHNGDNVTAWNYGLVVFSGPVSTFTVDSSKNTLYVTESATITITVHDQNGNPVVGGSEISLSTTLGSLSTDSITTGDPGVTVYTATLTNDLNPLLSGATSGSAVVLVELSSPNGNYIVESFPIFLSISSAP